MAIPLECDGPTIRHCLFRGKPARRWAGHDRDFFWGGFDENRPFAEKGGMDANKPPHTGALKPINCFACCHFFITYNPRFPYGCRSAGFKSRLMPAQEMFKHSGIRCQLFREKKTASA